MPADGKEKPVWLDRWMTEQQISELYSPSLRSAATAFFVHAREASIEWTELSLRGVIDSQHCSFRWTPEGWVPRCTCGYVRPHCMHTYMLHLMLKRLCREEGWTLPGQGTPGVFAEKELPGRREWGIIVQKEAVREESRGHGAARRLEVEADFRHNPCNVVIRFYVNSDGLRRLEDLCWIRDYAAELRRGKDPGWQEDDRLFLEWVLPVLRKCTLRELTGKLLILSKEDFRSWTDRWGDCPGRLIDRDSQKPLNEKQFRTPVRMQVELSRSKYGLDAGCAFYLEDGRKFFLHELVPMMLEDPTGFFLASKLKAFKPPVDWEVLMQNFGRCRLRLTDAEVVRHLPVILEHHLELLGEGPYITRRRMDASAVTLSAFIDERRRLALAVKGRLSGQELKSGIYRKGSGFEVVIVESDAQERLMELFRIHGASRDANDSTRHLLPGTPEGAVALAALWDEVPNSVEKRVSPELRGLLSGECGLELGLRLAEEGALLHAKASCLCNGTEISPDELQDALTSQRSILRGRDGRWFRLAPGALSGFLASLRDNGLEEGESLMLPSTARRLAGGASRSGTTPLKLAEGSLELLNRLEKGVRLEVKENLPGFSKLLRVYQREGVAFLAERTRHGIGSILADDMGLGKTLETLALLEGRRLALAENGRPFSALVVAPASVLDVWRREAVRCCPEMRCIIMRGSREDREELMKEGNGLLVTSYSLLRLDIGMLQTKSFDLLVLDEAQTIKNPDAQVTRCVASIRADCRIALTGTPLENRLADVCSILEIVNPGCLRGQDVAHAPDAELHAAVRRWLRLVMLRRTKAMVDVELPPKTEEIIRLDMPPEVRLAYNREIASAQRRAAEGGLVRVLAELTRMRRFCCSPSLVSPDAEIAEPKLDFLLERCGELLAGGHSVLVFSQFTSLLDIIAKRLDAERLPWSMITGKTPVSKRDEIAASFNNSAAPGVFLLSLKAAGTGLTLTRADYVFLFDPWWNPSVENQAIDRTHRIGQSRPVFAYRLVLADSVEEAVIRITEEKRELFASVIDEASFDAEESPFSEAELRSLLGNATRSQA